MMVIKRLCLLLFFVDLWISFAAYGSWFGTGMMVADDYPMAAIAEPWGGGIGALSWLLSLVLLLVLIVAYRTKNEWLRRGLFVFSVVSMGFIMYVVGQYGEFYDIVKERYNPATVQSTMIDVDAAELAGIQDGMIYCDATVTDEDAVRSHNSIRKNTDILVNNSHSTVYYYDAAQDEELLTDWGVTALPALVVLQDGAVAELVTEWDIVKYFWDTERFDYSW